MNRRTRQVILGLIIASFAILVFRYFKTANIAVLNPKGPIAAKERHLMFITVALCAIVVIPVFILAVFIPLRYREGNHKARYSPELDGGRLLEFIWWAVPGLIILVLSVVTWRGSHQLDPRQPIAGSFSTKPMTIQVVALNWKWLFIYPSENIASVNLVEFPVNTPVNFQITSDAAMNSFWIPQLGGQIYAMAGMSTQLHLEASQTGQYAGSSANISGRGFAGMKFTASAVSQASYDQWVNNIKFANNTLSLSQYNNLAKPSTDNSVAYYSSAEPGLYDNVIDRFMMPGMEAYIQ